MISLYSYLARILRNKHVFNEKLGIFACEKKYVPPLFLAKTWSRMIFQMFLMSFKDFVEWWFFFIGSESQFEIWWFYSRFLSSKLILFLWNKLPTHDSDNFSAVGSENVTNRSFLASVKSEKYAFWVHEPRRSQDPCITIFCEAKPSCLYQTYFSVSSPPQCWSQAVVCVSTPRMYPRSGYFLVYHKLILDQLMDLKIEVSAHQN